jgi:hypothetical protein
MGTMNGHTSADISVPSANIAVHCCVLFRGGTRLASLLAKGFAMLPKRTVLPSVCFSALEYCLNVENMNLSAIRTIRVLRPLRAINRIPSKLPTFS